MRLVLEMADSPNTVGTNNNNNGNGNNNNNNNNNNNGSGNGAANKKNNTTAKNNAKKNNKKSTTKKAPSAKTQARLDLEKRAKNMLNTELGIKSKPMEYKPIAKFLAKKYNSEKERVGNIDDHIELIRKQRAEKNAAKSATAKNKPVKKAKVKRTTVSGKESTYKNNMKAAKALLNHRLKIKSTPPEHNPIAKIMRAVYTNESKRNADINAHVEKVRKGREEAAKSGAILGRLKRNSTRKNRNS